MGPVLPAISFVPARITTTFGALSMTSGLKRSRASLRISAVSADAISGHDAAAGAAAGGLCAWIAGALRRITITACRIIIVRLQEKVASASRADYGPARAGRLIRRELEVTHRA